MYNDATSATALAATGGGLLAGANGIWWLLAAFALIATGSALARIVPRKQD
ncbi:hypothetical protein SEA_FIREMAN_84 [Microbacterium phage Fireman]|uniref:Uncharacterized protein n=3 Tax=Metamorphoovirus TaxID=2733195 RepID=A0A481VW48_9CAUD|nr:membrane protein [Microbacterium phage RobsFeet]YP_009820321.1 hypothetical protein HOV22_gp86 [Microbacterium phage Fireman]YP_010751825.1 hypothetical protein QDA09_gp80 [Microbacterium phage Tyrumbra]AWY06093.1 hypothetical protein SEA_ROBSFEET_87 [Microbacterium phage RobsFeet]QBI98166.1 hypothetical protein SEA_FIREMAN_84 [Microbacterium phage Fireman]QDP43617.1 hypothetical protein SEA_TYRUMBRA_80 [Microbacterium phage Tyrumbra]